MGASVRRLRPPGLRPGRARTGPARRSRTASVPACISTGPMARSRASSVLSGLARPPVAALRIVSLLPSASEIVCALGLADRLVGVTHECDWPPEVARLPALTRSAIPEAATSAEIDALVRERSEASGDGRPALYTLDEDALAALAPDVVVVACCSFTLERAMDDAGVFDAVPGWATVPAARAGRVAVVDGSALFARPGSHLVEASELLAHLLHPDVQPLPPGVRPPVWLPTRVPACAPRVRRACGAWHRSDGPARDARGTVPVRTRPGPEAAVPGRARRLPARTAPGARR